MLYSWVGIWVTCRWLLDVLAAFSGVETCSQMEHLGERWNLLLGKCGPTDHSCPLPSFWGNVQRRILNPNRLIPFTDLGRIGSSGLHRGLEGNAPCSSSRFGLNQKRRTCACLVIGSKWICWSDLVGKQLKQPVAPRSFKQKSKHHLSQNNSNMLNLVASAEVAMCEFPWTLANLWDLLINEKNKGPGPETFPYLGTRVSVLTRSPGLGSGGLLLLEMSRKTNSKQFEKPT